ncbi:MAG: 23S rRNA (adenine(2503)-C(2))-methyltransferase RlmN [Saprospiraceae bacterium]
MSDSIIETPIPSEIVKRDLRELSAEQLATWFDEQGEKKFRLKQLNQWLWQHGETDFDAMTNLGLGLRQNLKEHFDIPTLEEDVRQKSNDGTIKLRWKLHDGHLMESVLIPVAKDDRYTVCVSSQIGCSLTCSFCATGTMKRVRNLTAGEIYDQVKRVNDICKEVYDHGLTNIVYMGMGEPLLAYAPVMRSIELITSPDGMGMSPRRITISTAGIAKAILRLAKDQSKVNLALSLHAGDDTKRSNIMPINDSNNLEVLMDALEEYYNLTGNKMSYEYIALRGFNDSEQDAHLLANLCKRFPVHVNVIEYNTIEGGQFQKTDPQVLDRFARVLRERGVMITVRRSRGKDIDAACGQLANK